MPYDHLFGDSCLLTDNCRDVCTNHITLALFHVGKEMLKIFKINSNPFEAKLQQKWKGISYFVEKTLVTSRCSELRSLLPKRGESAVLRATRFLFEQGIV